MIRESAGEVGIMATLSPYPASLSIDYPDRPLNRLTTFFRIFTVIPIGIVLGLLAGGTGSSQSGDVHYQYGAVGIVFLPTVLMLLFRQKYPRWWYDSNLALTKFSYRVSSYLALLRDEYPSTDEEQAVHLDVPYPNAAQDLNRWLPPLKWFLPIPPPLFLFFPFFP